MNITDNDIRISIAVSICREVVKDDETLENLDVDSLTRMELTQDLEEKFNITLDPEAVAKWETVTDVVRDVQNMLITDTSHLDAINAAYGHEIKPIINRIERADVVHFNDNVTDSNIENDLDMYQQIATKSAIYPGKGTPFGLMYAALGLAEAGEVQNKVKKAFRDDGMIDMIETDRENQIYNVEFFELKPERRAQIIKELGGVLWYVAAVCDEIGATMSDVALTNLDELCSRGERDTLRGDGDNR